MTRGCKGTTQRGEHCRMAPLHGSSYCFNHAPEMESRRARSRRRGGRNRRAAKASCDPPDLGSPSAVRHVLEQAVGDTLVQENSIQRNRTLGYLGGVLLKVLEVGELEERVRALESTSKPEREE